MIIETQGLKKLYRTDLVETTALDSVNFSVDAGQFVSIMGPSGCGKSTLLHILGLIDTPNDGNYRFLGEDVVALPRKQARRDPQAQHRLRLPELQPDRRAHGLENIELPLVYAKTPAASARRKSTPCSSAWTSATAAITCPGSSRAVSSSASRSRARSSISRT